jgi:hypothetical protein
MKLEAVTAELRPRSEWEAVDLGLAMVRRNFWRLSAAWWLGMGPVLVGLPLAAKHPGGYLLVFWWWLPVGSRMALFLLSRELFGERIGWRGLLREWPRAMGRRLVYRLGWARLSPWRPLTMPVEDLEGLRGRAYQERCRVLLRRGDSTVMLLGVWRWLLTGWLVVSLFATAMLFLPEAVRSEWALALELFFEVGELGGPAGLSATLLGAALVAMWLVDLCATGCGFGIYVNHRTWIEGWDVELALRRLGRRLAGGGALLAIGAAALLGVPVEAAGVERAAAPEAVIRRVLEDPDFEVHTETQKSWDGWDFDGLGSGGPGEVLGAVLQATFWITVIGLLVGLIFRFRHLFKGRAVAGRVRAGSAPVRVVQGLEVRPESLPADVPAAARRAWRAGRPHEALGLLYRGSIAWMIRHGGVAIAESDTESDCLRRVRNAGVEHAGYFDRVTTSWMRLAYGREVPGDEQLEALCAGWPFLERGSR